MQRRWRSSTLPTIGSSSGARQRRHRTDRRGGGALGHRRRRQAHSRPLALARGRGREAGGAERQRGNRRLLDATAARRRRHWLLGSIRARRSSASSSMPTRTATTALPRSRHRAPYGDIPSPPCAMPVRSPAPASAASRATIPPLRIWGRPRRASPRAPAISCRAAARGRDAAQGAGAASAVLRRRSRPGEAAGHGLWADSTLGTEPRSRAAWYAAPSQGADRFREAVRSRSTSRTPPLLATLGYDAAALAAVLARNPNGPDFSPAALTNPSGFSGLNGIFRLLPNGIGRARSGRARGGIEPAPRRSIRRLRTFQREGY